MVPVMDTSMKSSPALSPMSEGEDRGRKRPKVNWLKKRKAMEKRIQWGGEQRLIYLPV